MALKLKYQYKHEEILRDARPWTVRVFMGAKEPGTALMFFTIAIVSMFVSPISAKFADITFLFAALYFWWFMTRPVKLPSKLPKSAQRKDANDRRPDGSRGMADGILYLGNEADTGEEMWFSNSDARTHCLYLGTTGSGKTVGLRGFAANALSWGSGYIYIDGKADTDLWSNLSAMARRFGRDDDLLIMNYMTGNVSGRVPSNTLNPFSSGSASYLANMLTSLMPDSEGDNAMWKDRAVALVSSLLPALVWKRENQNIPLSIAVIRNYLNFKSVIKLSRDAAVPEVLRTSIKGYLNELPGYVEKVFDDNGEEKPVSPDMGQVDTSVPRQQHGYLSMQFTRSMQSLGDDYGFIFDTQAADIDILDVVLNRRILIVLIPALEKSGDETANLGKIISSTLKGMMGATLGNTVEGEASTVIENKPTNASTPFIAIFDEVGYYTAQGMAVMAAQARSLGFSLIFASQDLPALEKRVKEEARSITANCNIKLFGKLEDPTSTKDFFDKTVGQALVTEVSSFQRPQGSLMGYQDGQSAGVTLRQRASYDALKGFNQGRAICAFGDGCTEMQFYNSDIGHAKSMRVHRFLPIPAPSEDALESLRQVDAVLKRLRNPKWRPDAVQLAPNADIAAIANGFADGRKAQASLTECSISAVAAVAEAHATIKPEDATSAEALADGPRAMSQEAEIAAAAQITTTTQGAGPLSWSEVVGASDVIPVRRDPPVTEAKASVPPVKDGGVSWQDVMGLSDAEAAGKLKGVVQQPMSWMDVIGAGAVTSAAPAPAASATTTTTTAAAPPAPRAPAPAPAPPMPSWAKGMPQPIPTQQPRPPVAAPAPVAPPVADPDRQRAQDAGVASPMSWGDIIGLTPGAPVPTPQETSEEIKKRAEEKGVGSPMSWMDVIGAPKDDDKKGGT